MSTPLFSVIVPVYNPPIDALESMIASVRSQSLSDWELVLVDDRSPNPAVRDALAAAAQADERVKVLERTENGGIVAASNTAVDAAVGEFVALLDHDDLLEPEALQEFALAIEQTPTADYLYSDEDKLGPDGSYFDRFDKPDWSPERLRGQMYTGHLSVLRTALVRQVGGFSAEADGSQDHDLVLKVTELARDIVHIPKVLYHWRLVEGSTAVDITNKPYAWDAGVAAVGRHLERVGIRGTADYGPVAGTYRIVREADLTTPVSIIIPTRGSSGTVHDRERVFVIEAVRSVLEHTRHESVEIVVVADRDTPDTVIRDLEVIAGDQLTVVVFDGPFNFSRKCNVGALAARGDALIWLNDDVECISDEIIGQLIAPLREPDVGITGAFLFFEDGTIQHAGHAHHLGQFTHAYIGEPAEHYGAFSSVLINRECSGLTAACIAMRREVFMEVGGFSESFPGNFNDVDLSIKVRSAGYRLVWLRDVRLFHFESRTRNPLVHSYEERQILNRWGSPARDPYLA